MDEIQFVRNQANLISPMNHIYLDILGKSTPASEGFFGDIGGAIASTCQQFGEWLMGIVRAIKNFFGNFFKKDPVDQGGLRHYEMEPVLLAELNLTTRTFGQYRADSMDSQEFFEDVRICLVNWNMLRMRLKQILIMNSADSFYKKIPLNPAIDKIISQLNTLAEYAKKKGSAPPSEHLVETGIHLAKISATIMECAEMTKLSSRSKYLNVVEGSKIQSQRL